MFRAPVALKSPGTLSLYSATGNLVRTVRFRGQELAVPLAGLEPGTYLARLTEAGQAFATRLLVVK